MAKQQINPIRDQTIEELKRRGRREPLQGGPGMGGECFRCGKKTSWELRGRALCLKCNYRPENRGADGMAAWG